MPEGPEVKRLVDQLNDEVRSLEINDAKIISGRYKNHNPPMGWNKFIENFKENSYLITSVDCKGKFILFKFSHNDVPCFLWNTLGMSGGWIIGNSKLDNHSRISFQLNDGRELIFRDIRNFGTLHFYFGINGEDTTEKKLASLGPDLLVEKVSNEIFKDRLLFYAAEKTISEALMNQAIFSGVGNYLKAEALYLARIHPNRKVMNLTNSEIENLHEAVTSLIRASYNSGGSTLQTYKDLYGNTGNFSSKFAVYGQKTDPNGNKVEKLKTKDGRTTYWVPALQY